MKSILLFLIILFNCAVFQRTNKITPSEFDYRKISENYFNSGGDKPFPLTVQRGNNLYNSVSKEGKYLFFSTDTNGNFDIYVRDLKTAVIAPVTEHPSSEYKPAISPDGKKLVYISERKDSLGDLVLVELDTEELIQDHLNGNKYQLKEIYLTDDSNSKNTFSDMDPTWSPDAKGIYFSSDRFSPGLLNIIYYEIKSKTFKQITTLGGSSPQISENGNHLVFISKRDNENGEIYLFDLREGKEERITRDSFLNTSPSLSPDGQEIFFTSTRRDTNKSGNIDTNDNSLIIRMNLQTREERILTSDSYSIFDTRYSNFNGGSIIFSAGLNNSINIYFIPINGQIPKKNSIQEQFNFATSLKRKESTISFFLALDAVKLFFKDDPLFPIIQSRVLDVKYEENSFLKNKFESDKNLYELKSYSNQPNWEFAEAIYLKNTNAGNNQILEYYNSLKYKNKSNSQTLASILYLLSDIYEYKNEIESQEKIFKILIQEYADFYREKEVQRKLAKIELQKNKKLIPERYFTLLDPTKIQIRELRKILTDIEQIYESDTKTQSSVLFFDEIIDSNQLKSKSKYLFELFLFLKAKKLNQERKFEQSNSLLDSFLPVIPPEPIECRVDPFCKKPITCVNDPVCMKSHLLKSKNFLSIGSPSKSFDEIRIFLESYNPDLGVEMDKEDMARSFRYYENKARDFESRGDLRQTAFNYFFNVENMYLLKYKNLFVNDLYKTYAVYYQKKMVDSVIAYAKKQADDDRNEILNRLNLLGKENLNLWGKITFVLSKVSEISDFTKFLGDFRDLQTDQVLGKKGSTEDAIKLIEQHFNLNRPRSRPVLYLASLYGYSYFLINKSVIYEKYYTENNSLTEVRLERILRDLKNAENELKWIIFSDPLYSDAYQLLGWLYQYIGLNRLKRLDSGESTQLYEKYFSTKHFEENINLYKQILDFLGKNENKKILSDLHLNLGNNYFLANNYIKAKEHYEVFEKFSSNLKPEIQFENYKQKALFYFHFGKLLVTQRENKKAIYYLNKSADVYYQNEYNNRKLDLENNLEQKNKNLDVYDKLALIHSYIGLAEQQSGLNREAINSFKKAIALNYNSTYIDSVKLYASLAYNYQKVEKYQLSDYYITKIEREYLRNYKWFRLPKLFDFLETTSGDSYLPRELNWNEYYLLAQGLRINNLTEQGEYLEVQEIIRKREEFLIQKGLDKKPIGEKILLNSKYKIAYDHFFDGNYKRALKVYDSLLDEINSKKLKSINFSLEKKKLLKRKSFSLFKLVERESEESETILRLIKDNLSDLKKEFSSEVENCLNGYSKKDDYENYQACVKKIQTEWYYFDPLVGLSYFYLAEIFFRDKNTALAYHYYGLANESIRNPSGVDVEKIGLKSDLFKKIERNRLKSNLLSIFLRVGDKKNFNDTLLEVEELSQELFLEEDSLKNKFLEIKNQFINRKYNLKDLSILLNDIQKLEEKFIDNYYLITELEDEFILDFYSVYQELTYTLKLYKKVHSLEEKKYSFLFMKHFLTSRIHFEEKKLEGLNDSIRILIRDEHRNRINQKVNIQNRASIQENKSLSLKNNSEIKKIIKNITTFFPEKKRLFEFSELTKPNYLNADIAFIKLKKMNDEILIHLAYDSKELDFTYSGNEIESYLKSLIPKTKDKIIILPDQNLVTENWNELRKNYDLSFAFLVRQAEVSLRQKIQLNDVLVNSESSNVSRTNFVNLNRIEEHKLKRLGVSIHDNDILATSIFYSNGNIFSPTEKGYLNLKEFTERASQLSVIQLNSIKFDSTNYFQTLGAIETIQSANIPIIVFTTEKNLKINYSEILKDKNRNRIGVLSNKSKDKKNLLSLAISFEKQNKYRESLENYLEAFDKEENSLKEELILARIKSKAIISEKPLIFYERLYQKYSKSELDKIIVLFFWVEECLLNYNSQTCSRNLSELENITNFSNIDNQLKQSILSRISFYYSILKGNTETKNSDFNLLKKYEDLKDPFLLAENLTRFYIKYSFYDLAESSAKISQEKAIHPIEKKIAIDLLNTIYFQKYVLELHSKKIFKDSDDLFSMALNSNWDKFISILSNFNTRSFDDSVLKFREKMYIHWMSLELGESVNILELSDELTSTKKTIYELLEEKDKLLLFHLCILSYHKQVEKEINTIFNNILKTYPNKNSLTVQYLLLKYMEETYYQNDFKTYLSLIENYKSVIDSIKDSKLKIRLYELENKFAANNQKTKSIQTNTRRLEFYRTNEIKLQEYYSLLNDYIEFEKNDPNSVKNINSYIEFLQTKAMNSEDNLSSVFLDLSFYKDRFEFYIKNKTSLPKFIPVSIHLQKKLPKDQYFIILTNLGNSTYRFKLNNSEILGELVLEDNRKLKKEVYDYYEYIFKNESFKLQKDLLETKLRNLLDLKKNSLHYIYLSSFLYKIPFDYRDEDKALFISRPDLLASRDTKKMNLLKEEFEFTFEKDNSINLSLELLKLELKNSTNPKYTIDILVKELKVKDNKDILISKKSILEANISNRTSYILFNNKTSKNSYQNDNLNYLLQNIDEYYSGIGMFSIIDNRLQPTVKFITQLKNIENTKLSLIDRFQNSLKEVKSNYPNEIDWIGYRISTNVFWEN